MTAVDAGAAQLNPSPDATGGGAEQCLCSAYVDSLHPLLVPPFARTVIQNVEAVSESYRTRRPDSRDPLQSRSRQTATARADFASDSGRSHRPRGAAAREPTR